MEDKELLYELLDEYLHISFDIKCMSNVLEELKDKAETEQNNEVLYKVNMIKIVIDSINNKLVDVNDRLDEYLLKR